MKTTGNSKDTNNDSRDTNNDPNDKKNPRRSNQARNYWMYDGKTEGGGAPRVWNGKEESLNELPAPSLMKWGKDEEVWNKK